MEKSCIAGFPWVWSVRGILRKKGCIQVGHPCKGVCWHTGPSCRMKGTGISCDLIKSLGNLHCGLHFPAHWPPRGGGKMDRILVKSFLPLPCGPGHRPVASRGSWGRGGRFQEPSVVVGSWIADRARGGEHQGARVLPPALRREAG